MSTDDLFASPPTSCFPPPREFQDHAHRELRSGFLAGHQRQIIMAPTGSGKTFLALRICNEALARGKRVLFVCDRKTLINQTSAVADGYGMPPHGIIQADNPRMALWRPFQIASAQTLAARGVTDDFGVVVVDEAHSRLRVTEDLVMATKAAVIGLSATPFSKGLGTVYSRVVNAATMDELVKLKILKQLRVLSCVKPDMKGAKTTGGEWTAKEAETRGLVLVGDVVREWLDHGENRKTIVFGPTVVHCEHLVEQFRAAGVGAATFTGQTGDDERTELLREYRKPDSKIRVLVSVEALAKGFDVPDVACVVDCRPLRKSLSTFIQMVGRGLRGFPGQQDCLLLDHSGNAHRFRDSFADVYFNGLAELDAGEKLDQEVRKDDTKPPRACPSCGFTPVGKRCIRCGFETSRVSLVEHAEGRAGEFDMLGTGARAYAATLPELYAAIATYERGRWERRGRVGKPEGATAHRFRELTGKWPPSTLSFATAPHVVPTRALQGKLRSLEIAFARRVK